MEGAGGRERSNAACLSIGETGGERARVPHGAGDFFKGGVPQWLTGRGEEGKKRHANGKWPFAMCGPLPASLPVLFNHMSFSHETHAQFAQVFLLYY